MYCYWTFEYKMGAGPWKSQCKRVLQMEAAKKVEKVKRPLFKQKKYGLDFVDIWLIHWWDMGNILYIYGWWMIVLMYELNMISYCSCKGQRDCGVLMIVYISNFFLFRSNRSHNRDIGHLLGVWSCPHFSGCLCLYL